MPQAKGLNTSEQVQQSPQYIALNEFVSDKAAVGAAADKFCEPVESKFQSTQGPDDAEELLITSWQAIIAKAAETSFQDPSVLKLVDFVTGIQERKTLQKDGKTAVVHDMTVWKDLPVFGWQMREAWNFPVEDRSSQEHRDQWINLNAFAAALVASAHSKTNDQPDFSLYCIWSVRQALEEDVSFEVSTAAAAVWFVYAAPTIKDFCNQNKSFDGKLAKGGFSYKNQGWTGFSQERWQVWQEKLKDVQGQVKDETTKELVEEALKAMAQAS